MSWGSKPYQTWINHGLIGLAIMHACILLGFTDAESFRLAVWGYLFRELAQFQQKVFNKKEIHWLDHFMDALFPAVTCGIYLAYLTYLT